jgi:hypothetical protein
VADFGCTTSRIELSRDQALLLEDQSRSSKRRSDGIHLHKARGDREPTLSNIVAASPRIN